MQYASAIGPVDTLIHALMRAAPSAVLTFDVLGNVTNLNEPASRLFSTTPEQAIGQPYQSVLGASLSDRLVGLFVRSGRAEQNVSPHVVRTTLPDGRRAELRANLGPVRDASGRTTEVMLVADEVTEAAQQQSEVTDRLRLALRRYLGDDIAAMVEQRPSFVRVGGVRRRVSVVHADIRGYTTLAEKLLPEDTMVLLLKYHGSAVAALQAEGATLDRFIGDSVLAIWNAPHDYAAHAAGSLRGALAVQRAARDTGTDLAYGIGVHTGDAIVGNIGADTYMNYTAVGDTVNLAARLQSEAKPGQVLCTREVLNAANQLFEARPLGSMRVRGRAGSVDVLELLGYRGAL